MGKEARTIMLTAGDMKLLEHANQYHIVHAPESASIADITQRSFWSFVATKLKPEDPVRVFAHDKTWMAECLVINSTDTEATVVILHKHDLKPKYLEDEAQNSEMYKVDFVKGPARWRIIRLADNTVIRSHFESEAAAKKELNDYVKMVA